MNKCEFCKNNGSIKTTTGYMCYDCLEGSITITPDQIANRTRKLDRKNITAYNINQTIQGLIRDEELDANDVSDGYHTFGELYKHRIHLFIALCKSLNKNYKIIKSWLHDDGSKYDGWFIVQITHEHIGQISYHLPDKYWTTCDFIEVRANASKWDGHTSDDVLERLLEI